MNRAAISSARAKQQVERFVRVAAMADQYDLSDEQKQYALVKAYERHGERIGMRAAGGVVPPPAIPTGPVIMDRISDSHI